MRDEKMRITLRELRKLIRKTISESYLAMHPKTTDKSFERYAASVAPDSSYFVRDADIGKRLAKDEEDAIEHTRRRDAGWKFSPPKVSGVRQDKERTSRRTALAHTERPRDKESLPATVVPPRKRS